MGVEFVVRIVKTTTVVAFVAALFSATYFSPAAGAGLWLGAVWGCLNLLATSHAVRLLIATEKPGKLRVLLLSFVKFPLLYGLGFLLLRIGVFSPESLVSGFSLVLLIILLKALGASMAGSFRAKDGKRVKGGGAVPEIRELPPLESGSRLHAARR